MEYKTAKELKPKEYIIDPESDNTFQIINVKPGNKPRIMYRDLKKNKISEIIVSSKKQYLLAEVEEYSYQLNYYSENNLYITDYNTYEESIFDGSILEDSLKDLKSKFDSGIGIELKVQKIGNDSILTGYSVVKEQISVVSEPQKPKDLGGKRENKKERKTTQLSESKKESPELIKTMKKVSVEVKQEKTKIWDPKSTPTKEAPKSYEKIFSYKEFKGLGEKTFNILVNDYKITSLLDLINADINELKKIPKVSEKKINDWKNQAKKLVEK